MFNRKHLLRNISSNLGNILDSEFLNFIKADMIDRLVGLDAKAPKVLAIRDHEKFITSRISDQFEVKEAKHIDDEEALRDLDEQFDLVIFPFGLHWTNDVQEFLALVASKLTDNGLLMCSFAGGGSLQELRKSFYQLEDKYSKAHSPHIVPMIRFDHVTSLLSGAGLSENVVDMEKFEIEFDSPLKACKAIKNVGEGNVLLAHPGYSITKEMYADLACDLPDKFVDNVNLITFIAAKSKNSIRLNNHD